jgi:predicted protein tyrosine phosphatase
MTNTNICEISHIYKNIYISDIQYSYNIKKLINNNIWAILYLGTSNKSQKILDLYKTCGINHLFLKIDDDINSDISQCFQPAWEFINNNVKSGYNILIHCKKGISRSPAIVAYYLMRKMFERMKTKCTMEPIMDDVLKLIYINRPCSNLNKTFIQQLKKYEYSNIK